MIPLCLSADAALGGDTDLVVDVIAGGLVTAATILTARHGVSVTCEGVPLLIPSLERYTWITDAGTPFTGSILGQQCGFRFTYPATATPRDAAEAAAAAYNQTGCPGHYAVLEDQGILHFVPYETRLDDTKWQPYAPLLDTPLELKVTEGSPNQVLNGIREQLRAASGAKILEPEVGIGAAGPAVVHMPRATGTARQILDDLLLQLGQETHYLVVYAVSDTEPDFEGFALMFLLTTPTDESALNRTPLTAPAPE